MRYVLFTLLGNAFGNRHVVPLARADINLQQRDGQRLG